MGSFVKKHRGKALKLSRDSRAGFAKNTHKCFSCREGNLEQGDDLIPRSKIHKRQRRDQLKDSTEEGSSSKDNAIFRKPFRGYTETLRGSVVTVSPILG